jgi:S-methylmethionine-dependent homocysteine/selenocysteine methylase
MGDATESLMGALKDLQKDQLKKDFEELKKLPKGSNKKLTRTEKEAAKDAALNAVIAAEEQKDADMVDVFDISAPVDILQKFTIEWIQEAQALVKWNERVDKMKEI